MASVAQSPDMKFARNKLEDLLSSMKKNVVTPHKFDSDDDETGSLGFRQCESQATGKRSCLSTPGKSFSAETPLPKIARRNNDKKILFELRQKPFELPSTTENYNLYKLCRIWLNGKDVCIEDSRSKDGNNASQIRSFQHMAINIKQIETMPRIKIDDKIQRVPSPIAGDPETIEGVVDVSSKEAILASFMPRWKATKRKWNKASREFSQCVAAENVKILKEAFVPSVSYF